MYADYEFYSSVYHGTLLDENGFALYGARYTVYPASRMSEEKDFVCTVAGRCCESGDLLAEGSVIAEPSRGDILAVLVTGAYNYSMASNYNRIPRPPVIELSGGKATVAVRRETYDDLIRLDV